MASQETLDILFRMKADVDEMRKLTRESAKAKKGFTDIKNLLGRGLGLLGLAGGLTAAVAGMRNLFKASIDTARQLTAMSKTLGINVEFLQAWTAEAADFNIEQNAATMGLQRFTRRLGEAQAGGGELLKTIEKYNVALVDSDGKQRNAVDVLADFADVLKNAKTQQERLAIGFKMFDSEGARLITMLDNGAMSVETMTQRMEEAGEVASAEAVEALDRFGDSAERLWRKLRVWSTETAGSFFGAMSVDPETTAELERLFNVLRAEGMSEEDAFNQLPNVFELQKQMRAAAREASGDAAGSPLGLTPEQLEELDRIEDKMAAIFNKTSDLFLTEQEILEVRRWEAAQLEEKIAAEDDLLERKKLELELAQKLYEVERQQIRINEEAAESNPWADFIETMETSVLSTHNLADAMTGLITQTKTWGDVGRAASTMILNAMIQIGLEMVKNAILGDAIDAKEKTKTSGEIIPEAVKAGFKSISDLGPIFGPIAFAASVAAIMALAKNVGGFETGGIVPGTPSRKDNRFARVASGEAIIPTMQTQRYRPAIDDLIAGRDPGPRFAAASSSLSSSSSSPSAPPTVNVISVNDRQEMLNRMDALNGDVRMLKRRAGYRS
jgi:hypothetical protein